VWCPLCLTAVSPQGGSQGGRTSSSLSTAPVDEQWSLEAMCAPAVLCGPFASAMSCGQPLSQHDGGVDDSRHGVGRSGVGSGSGSVGSAGEGAAAPAVDCTASPVTSSVTNSSVAASAATSLRPWMWLWLLLDVAVVIVVVWVAVAATRSTSNLFSAVRDPLSFYNRFLTDATARVNTVCHTGQAPCFCAWDDAPPQCWLSADCPLAQVCAPTSSVPFCVCLLSPFCGDCFCDSDSDGDCVCVCYCDCDCNWCGCYSQCVGSCTNVLALAGDCEPSVFQYTCGCVSGVGCRNTTMTYDTTRMRPGVATGLRQCRAHFQTIVGVVWLGVVTQLVFLMSELVLRGPGRSVVLAARSWCRRVRQRLPASCCQCCRRGTAPADEHESLIPSW
jgi:hypothetical protein